MTPTVRKLPTTMAMPKSAAAVVGGVAYLSGHVGVDRAGEVPEGFEAQARLAVANLEETLERAGATLASVARVLVVLTRQEHFAPLNALWEQVFPRPFPARTTIVAAGADPRYLIEVEAIAEVVADRSPAAAATPKEAADA